MKFNFYRDSTKLLTTVVICIILSIAFSFLFQGMNYPNTGLVVLSFLGVLVLGLVGLRLVYKIWYPKEDNESKESNSNISGSSTPTVD